MIYKRTFLLCIVSILSFNTSDLYSQNSPRSGIEDAILRDKSNFYYIDSKNYPSGNRSLPIGVFDSGTGGLTILNTLIQFDQNNNSTKINGKDNVPDFASEKFIYLADQANMPYGNYYSEKKNDLLVENVLKDAQFLLSDKYYLQGSSKSYSSDKQKVKAIVIACNTATAYGKEYIEGFIKKTGINLKVIGVIDAGAQGTLDVFKKNENGSIGVFATVGTIASKGYEKTIVNLKNKLGYTGNLQVYNQGGYGLAEAVDEEPDFISRKATLPRSNYRGPAMESGEYKIEKTLLDIYNFDFDNNKMLCDNKTDDCGSMQLNSADNYARFHLVSLMEKIRKTLGSQPLKALVLGCTHYPFLIKDIRGILKELYTYQKNGKYIYRAFMVKDIKIIDPAVNVAIELHDFLNKQNLFNPTGDMKASEFFISVPNKDNKNVVTDEQGRFTYKYKYGRNAGEIQEYVKVVPFSRSNIPSETLDRIKTVIPSTYTLINKFHSTNPKTLALPEKDRIKE
ncbi:MAG TPA: hypothetical protein VNI52_04910 [Sphingobacteriaceae bacterium]|nr:hypothetical protein [Sphingobacteriaceae bacterium]